MVLEAFASYETGGNTRFSGGRVADSGHERSAYGAGFGYRTDPNNEVFIEYRHQDTNDTGNPPYAMDIRFFNTDSLTVRTKNQWGQTQLNTRLGYGFVDHAMDNYSLRPAPADPAKYRQSLAQALTWTYGGEVQTPLAGGTLSLGVDGTRERHNTRIENPNNANFIVQNFNRYDENRLGGFVQWSGDPTPNLMVEAGVRLDRIATSIEEANASFVFPAPVQMLAMNFNALDRKVTDHNFDAVLRTSYTLNDQTTLRLGLARKERTPMYVERFGWLPIPASAGLADGNIYVGDVGLKPESALVLDTGVDWQGPGAYFRPSVYYRRINNYIQGVPYDDTPGLINTAVEMVAGANSDPTPLRFANVDAALYGLDADFGFVITGPWRVDGVASFVRGKRRDITDNLYRITPPRLSTTLSYMGDNWSSGVQMVAVDHQNKVSLTNSEQATGGSVLINLMARWDVKPGISLSGGVENLFDRAYEDHLSGYNRVMGSDVAMGARIPGAGRGIYLRLGLKT
jgi:iron complex outermembrane receptor protein